jgi:hypothetical protein
MTKVACTFRLDAELVKRLKDTSTRSGGKISQAEIVESALADRFAVKDGTKLLAKVSQDQQTALTIYKEQSQALTAYQERFTEVANNNARKVAEKVAALQQTTTQELRGNTASVNTMQQQMAQAISTLRQIENSVQEHAKARLEAWQYIAVGVMMGFALLGAASFVWWLMRYSGRF